MAPTEQAPMSPAQTAKASYLMRKSMSAGTLTSPPVAPDASAAFDRLDSLCRRSSYSDIHGNLGEKVFEKSRRSSLPELPKGRPLTPPPLEAIDGLAGFNQRPATGPGVGPNGLTAVPMTPQQRARKAIASKPEELEKKRIEMHYTTSYAKQFPHYGDAAKPSMSTKTEFPAPFKTASEHRALAERQSAYWKDISEAQKNELNNTHGHLTKKLDLGIVLTMPAEPPKSTMHHQYTLGMSSGSWKSELRESLNMKAHGRNSNEKYQQPSRLCVLAKHK